ncbi:unannotated protein [freshwater metagenome]|uniref:Unannotated protein n=1 Tax=freshwater metagenome TaxID=449393 RepID=A0A6J6D0P5_9ZZZZ|nr:hypothetical protein [Actinomycetota bacterium]
MNSKPAPRRRDEASRITPPCIVGDTLRRFSALGQFAYGAVSHGAHQTATDEQLIAWLFGYQLRALNLQFEGLLGDVREEIGRRSALAKAIMQKGDASGRLHRLQRMAYGHVLTCRGVEVGIIDRMARRASAVGFFLMKLSVANDEQRAQIVATATDQTLIDVKFWNDFIVDNAGESSRAAKGIVLGDDTAVIRQEIRDRIDELHDPELNPELNPGFNEDLDPYVQAEFDLGLPPAPSPARVKRPRGPHTPVPKYKDEFAIFDYRVDHNLPDNDPFWTDERILAALQLGME